MCSCFAEMTPCSAGLLWGFAPAWNSSCLCIACLTSHKDPNWCFYCSFLTFFFFPPGRISAVHSERSLEHRVVIPPRPPLRGASWRSLRGGFWAGGGGSLFPVLSLTELKSPRPSLPHAVCSGLAAPLARTKSV